MAAASPHSPISTGLTAGSAPRALSEDDILAAAPYVRAARGESREHCLGRVTHIHVQRRRLTSLQGIHAAPQLKVVYAFENSITSLPADLTVCRYARVGRGAVAQRRLAQAPTRACCITVHACATHARACTRTCRHLQVLMLDSNQIRLLSNLTECHELEVCGSGREPATAPYRCRPRTRTLSGTRTNARAEVVLT
ncbi:hypothetical protein EON67_08710 [archaeon]|nr:MAG: hypothetical protein EON67_08710 [archaeon]